MTKRVYIVLGLLVLLSGITFGKVVATLSEVMKPLQIVIDEDQLYVIEKAKIYIYSLKDYKFIKMFGKPGEGPGEFNSITSIIPFKGSILVNSLGKISYYKKNGSLINEKKIDSSFATGGLNLYPLKRGFVGNRTTMKEKVLYKTINLFDSDFKKVKELNEMLAASKNKFNLLSKSFFYQTYRNKIFISSKTGLSIDVLNDKGEKLYIINYQNYKRRKFNEETIREKMKRKNKQKYEILKNRLKFPEFYPEILKFFISDEKLYIATWKWENKKIEFFIFTIKGKLLNHTYIPLFFNDGMFPYPHPLTINNNNLYQIVENEDTETWELHENVIK